MEAMRLTVDKAGRIVLPKQVRERLRLRAGSSLELEERPEGLVLRPVGQVTSMIKKNGVWVHLGRLPRSRDWRRILDDVRDECIIERYLLD